MLIILIILAALVLFALVEFLVIKFGGSEVPAPTIPRGVRQLGNGPELTYVVMGDSTSIGQGTDYKNSYAVASAAHLAQDYRVHWVNVGVSGAVTKDVLDTQLSKAVNYKPDLVLVAVGANDARKFVSGRTIQTSLQQIVDGLKQSNCAVHIVVTGAPEMAVPRFPWPSKQVMAWRTRQVNAAVAPLVSQNQLTFAPVAVKTGAAFRADPTLFAADKFHPNARGYELWKPVINDALDEALRTPVPADCPKSEL